MELRASSRASSSWWKTLPEDAPLAGIEGVRVVAQVVDEHVEVPHRAQHPAEPAELEPQRLRPVGIEQWTTRAQERAQPPRGHAHLVELLGIAAEPRSGIVRHDGPVLGLEHRLQMLPRRRVAARCRALRRPFEVERLEDLRAAVALARHRPPGAPCRASASPFSSPSTSSTSSSRNERTIFLSAMTETTSIVTSATAPVAASVRIPERFVRRTATGSSGMAPCVRGEQLGHLGGHRARGAGQLELETVGPAWQLQLPEPAAVLHPPAQRDARAGEAVVGRVVVGRREGPVGECRPRELGQPERAVGRQLQLALEVLRHGAQGSPIVRIGITGTRRSRHRHRKGWLAGGRRSLTTGQAAALPPFHESFTEPTTTAPRSPREAGRERSWRP